MWTWADNRSAAFVLRRQAQEALVHPRRRRVHGRRPHPLDATLAADGVDEVLHVVFGGAPADGELEVDAATTVRPGCPDTGGTRLVTSARYAGAAQEGLPASGPTPALAADDHGLPTAATVSAAAGDLGCWLWGPAAARRRRAGRGRAGARRAARGRRRGDQLSGPVSADGRPLG